MSNGIAEGAKPPMLFSPDRNLLWKTELPEGFSSPCIWGDSIFLTGFQTGTTKLETICVDRLTGTIKWRGIREVEQIEPHHEISNPATSTPVTDGTSVVVYFGSFGLLAYDFEGNELWRTRLPMAKSARGYGSSTSPVMARGKIFLDVQLDADSYLGAFDSTTGKEIWKAPRPLYNRGYSTPVLWEEESRGRVGLSAAGRFIAYDAETGKQAWWLDGLAVQVCATPVIHEGILYITSAGAQGESDNMTVPIPFEEALANFDHNGDGKIAVSEVPDDLLVTDRKASDGAGNMSLKKVFGYVGIDSNALLEKEKWEEVRTQIANFKNGDLNRTSMMAVKVGGEGDLSEANLLWRESRGVGEVSSPLYYDHRIYLIKNGGVLTVRAAETGKLIYSERVGALGGYYASPVAAGGRIYFASDGGDVSVIQPGDEFKLLAKNELHEPIYASPAVIGDTLFIRTKGHLYAFRESEN